MCNVIKVLCKFYKVPTVNKNGILCNDGLIFNIIHHSFSFIYSQFVKIIHFTVSKLQIVYFRAY